MIELMGYKIKLKIYDQMSKGRMEPRFYSKANGIILTIDITKRKNFENINDWFKEIDRFCLDSNFRLNNFVPVLVVGCKCDLELDRKISVPEIKQKCDSLGFHYIESSSENYYNVEESFYYLTSLIMKHTIENLSDVFDFSFYDQLSFDGYSDSPFFFKNVVVNFLLSMKRINIKLPKYIFFGIVKFYYQFSLDYRFRDYVDRLKLIDIKQEVDTYVPPPLVREKIQNERERCFIF
eukprot:TRINITY_DN12295_c0_g1_i1.p1 TRINITY_DN12295_c0_g1~~TRINITY_DN12295_c0_g1_i1.p1  ORF type:complete len:236 (-),score=37.33 TRINITY_DN12295_c0_g1_i1:20-727(-)